MNPLVSIIMPTRNGARFIVGAIESVIAQTYTHWELIIVNDGSTDTTRSIVEKYTSLDKRIVCIDGQTNEGIQKSLNKGIVYSQGEFIARIDDDDQWIDQRKIAEQIAFFERHPSHVLIGTNASVVAEDGRNISHNYMPTSDELIRRRLLAKNCFLHSTVMLRKNAIEKVGGYTEKKVFRHAEDYELWLRIGKVGKMANLTFVSTALMNHSRSITAQHRVIQARNVLRASWRYRHEYPHALGGLITATARYIGFICISIIPLPHKWLLGIQRLYRSV